MIGVWLAILVSVFAVAAPVQAQEPTCFLDGPFEISTFTYREVFFQVETWDTSFYRVCVASGNVGITAQGGQSSTGYVKAGECHDMYWPWGEQDWEEWGALNFNFSLDPQDTVIYEEGFCYDTPPPTPTPTPTPTPMPTPTPVAGSEIPVVWHDAGCIQAQVASCAANTVTPRLYANGLYINLCQDAEGAIFTARPYLSDTITLVDTAPFTLTNLSIVCTEYLSGAHPLPTPTLSLMVAEEITLTAEQEAVLAGSGGYLGIDFGGSLSNPNSPINRWLGHGTDFVNIVNTGNILYVIGAVAAAGAVLAWAIGIVKNPERF